MTEVLAAPAALLAIDAEVDPRPCYALAYNRKPPVSEVRVRNIAGGLTGPLTISITSSWSVSDIPPLKPVTFQIDCPDPGHEFIKDTSSTRLSDEALATLAEAAPATITITVTDAEGYAQSVEREITVLARDQWLFQLQEISAAFVQPNHPDVPEIVSDAAVILGKATGSTAMDAYQSGSPERVVAMAEAIFMALRKRVTNYVMSPADFAEEGQRVRPLDEVLATGQGNCIELACAYASCLLNVGLDATLFLVHGHAFTGIYLAAPNEQTRWTQSNTTELASILNIMDRGLAISVETTAIPETVSFADAVNVTKRHFAERMNGCGPCAYLQSKGAPIEMHPHMESVIDIAVARREGVKVLPARKTENGVVTIYIDNGIGQPPVVERRDAQTHRLLPETVPARVQQWKNSLLDLSRRNPLISFNAANSGIELFPPNGILGEIEDHLVEGRSLAVHGNENINQVLQAAGIRYVQQVQEDDRRDFWRANHAVFGTVARGSLEARARTLMSRAKTEEQDTGSNNLHVALGTLSWPFEGQRTSAGITVTSPVFLVPIRMTLKRGQRIPTIAMDPGSITTVNYSLLHLLRTRFNMTLPWFNEDMRDDSGLNIIEGLNVLRGELLELGLADRGLRVDDTASIGLFRFNKTRLWKDLDEHWKEFAENPVVRHLISGSVGAFADPADPEGHGTPAFDDTTLLNPQLADGAQSRAIVKSISGQSFVLEGPPGTGKSQTITNLLANALAHGKKVLFVAAKPAALNVVKERLQASGLAPFTLDLHDSKAKPEDIKIQLRDALEFQPSADMDRWEKNQANFTSAARALAMYRDRLHDKTPAGQSFFDAYQSLLSMGDGPVADIGRALASVPRERVGEIVEVLRELPELTNAARPSHGHPWSLADIRSFDDVDRRGLADAIQTIARVLEALPTPESAWGAALQACRTPGDLGAVAAAARLDAAGRLPQSREWRSIARPEWRERAVAAIDEASDALSAAGALDASLGPIALATDLNTQLATVIEAGGSFALGRKGRLRTALGAFAGLPVFATADPEKTVAVFRALAEHSYHFRNGVYLLSQLEGFSGISGAPSQTDLTDLRHRVEILHQIGSRVSQGGVLADALVAAMDGFQAAPEGDSLQQIHEAVTTITSLLHVTEETSTLWAGSRSLIRALQESISHWISGIDGLAFVGLQRWIDLVNHISLLEEQPLASFRQQILTGSIPGADALEAFERALLQAVLTVVGEENKFDVFDQAGHNRLVSRFVDLLRERQSLLSTVIPQMLHQARTFNASTTAGTVGQLRTELNAKRRGARSIRDLLTKYPELISELTPCFLMSPDSVAKYLVPGKITFDVIVFDEASQIPVSDAIGAMGRATSVVVVGDSKQMPPTSVFAASNDTLDEEDDYGYISDATPTDEESILDECVESGLPREMLTWHYRSRDEILIDFSNRTYYEGRLATFPTPVPRRPDCGLVYHRVQGQFIHGTREARSRDADERSGAPIQTNPIEADAIVAEVVRRANDPLLSQFSMGIVTLNAAQKDLILRKLNEAGDPKVNALLDTEDPEQELFVLNLESVQGRERDVIILGTAFSKRADGSAMPLNFGPLNNKGGERRLNVAITRARRQVVIFSSFDPTELDRANAQGLTHLRDYLKLAQGVSNQSSDAVGTTTPDDPYVAAVADGLRSRGLIVKTHLGLSSFKVDLAVTTPEHSDRWLVGVLIDGPRWARRDLALDRDALPSTVLHGLMDWPAIARVWLPAWRRDPDEILNEISELVHITAEAPAAQEPPSAVAAPETPAQSTAAVDLLPDHLVDAAVDAATEQSAGDAPAIPSPRAAVNPLQAAEQTYVTWHPRLVGAPEDLEHSGNTIHRLLTDVADTEGPLPVDAALRKVARCFGLERVRENRISAMHPHVPASHRVRTPFGDFLFPRQYVDTSGTVTDDFTWFRRTTAAERKIDAIAPHEIANAMVHIATSAHGISREELAAEVLTTFGYARKTSDTLAHVLAVLDWVVAQGGLQDRNGLLTST